MHKPRKAVLTGLLAASALLCPAMAQAAAKTPSATAREADLAARLERLEAEMMQLRADLQTARAEQAATAQVAE
ncbi:MAG: hypothetical protein IT550_03215, partial [Novosphingobium sp.]|nr:hypothetical protein [Novosphingobium sp.]